MENATRSGRPSSRSLWPHFLPDGSIVAVTVGEPTPNAQWLGKPLPATGGQRPADPQPVALPRRRRQAAALDVVCRRLGPLPRRRPPDRRHRVRTRARPVPAARQGPRRPSSSRSTAVRRTSRTTSHARRWPRVSSEAEISPDGKTFAFGLQNEIWTVPVEKPKTRDPDDAARLTDYPGYDGDFSTGRRTARRCTSSQTEHSTTAIYADGCDDQGGSPDLERSRRRQLAAGLAGRQVGRILGTRPGW